MMKPNTKIRKDDRGQFVRNDGMVFRPDVESRYAVFQPMYWNAHEAGERPDRKFAYNADPDLFKVGEPVHARHVSQTPYARVTSPDGARVAIVWGER